jgi:hypothetical protein
MNLLETIKYLRELEAKATPGSWRAADYTGEPTGLKGIACDSLEVFPVQPGAITRSEDAEFIAETRNELPGLLDALEKENLYLRTKLLGNSWKGAEEMKAQLDEAKDVLEFYAGHSRSDTRRIQSMNQGGAARALLEKWKKV